MAGHVTIKNVARRAGCSPAVVSTVVNGARGNTVVGSALREQVLRAAADLGYRRNFASRSLVNQRTRTLGVYIPSSPWAGLGYSYDDTILRGVEAASREHGYDLLLISLTGSQAPAACLDKFAERRIDGLILVHVDEEAPWVGELLARGCSVVAADYTGREEGLDAMVFDNLAVSRVAVEHLAGLGHRRIGFVGSCRQPASRDSVLRQQGFLEVTAEMSLEVAPEWVFDGRLLARPIAPDDGVCQIEGRAAAQHIVALGQRGPTAWVAYCDLVAVTMLPILRAAGVPVPEQVSLMGVDDSEWCRVVDPPLTSVGHPLEDMGRRAVEQLVSRIETDTVDGAGGTRQGMRVVFPPTVVPRLSTGRVCPAKDSAWKYPVAGAAALK